MTLERNTNPLPDGRYWVELNDPGRASFQTWQNDNKDQIKVETTESDEESSPPWSFFIFNVTNRVKVPGGTGSINVPVVWDAKSWGFPTIAPPSLKSRADAIQAPDLPPSGTDQLGNLLGTSGAGGLLGGLESGLKIAGYGLGAWVLLKLLSAFGKKS
jgi:hypothetical protein